MTSSYSGLFCSFKYSAYYKQFARSPRTMLALRCQSSVSSSTDRKLLPFSAIPGPKGTLPNVFDYTKNGGFPNLVEILRQRFQRFGPIYSEQMFGRTILNISDADAMEEVLRLPSFPMRPGFDAADMINEELGYPASGISSNKYEKWFKERALLSPKMLRPKEVSNAFPGLNGVARDVVERISHLRREDGTVRDLERELFHWAVESISTFFFDQRLGFYDNPPKPEAVELVKATHDLTYNAGKIIFGFPFYKYFNTPTYNAFKKAVDTIYSVGLDILHKTVLKQGNQGKATGKEAKMTFFDELSTSNELSPELIANILVALSVAGIETTSTTFLWLLYQLSRHPQAQEKLYQELKSVLGAEGEISSKTIGHLPFLKSCLKESLRVIPTTFFIPRKFDHDIEVIGYNIPAGVDIMMYTLVVNTDEKYYGENAKEFVPERWLRDKTAKNEYNPFAALSFGYGVRMCIGRRIAEAEIYTLLSQLLLRFRLEYVGQGELNPQMDGITLRPNNPLVIKFMQR